MLSLNWKRRSFGLDISEGAFRIVQLKKTTNKIKLISYNATPVPKGVFKDGNIVQEETAVELLQKTIKEAKGAKISSNFVNACLAETKTFIKLISISGIGGKDEILNEIVEESKKHIPYAFEDVYLDWQYCSTNKEVLIGVCPKEIVENYQKVILKAGLTPIALEIEAVSIVRCLFPPKIKVEKPVMIVDLGANRASLIVYFNDAIPFTLSIKFSGELLTKMISQNLKISPAEAELAKRTIGLDKAKAGGAVYEILENEFKKLAQRIREARYFYHEHFFGHYDIQEMLLTGGGAHMPGLAEFLSEEISMNVKIANPLVNINTGRLKMDELDANSYVTAIGLALRNFYLTE